MNAKNIQIDETSKLKETQELKKVNLTILNLSESKNIVTVNKIFERTD